MNTFLRISIFTVLLFFYSTLPCQAKEWTIVINKNLQTDEAIKVAISDLIETGKQTGNSFTLANDSKLPDTPSILVGRPDQNKLVSKYASKLVLEKNIISQGFQISTTKINGRKIIVISGGDILGNVYGLFWLCDRIRVNDSIPDINVIREPESKIRISPSWGRRGADGNSKEEIRNALRNGLNWVSGPAILDLVPWKTEPEKSNNEKTRQKTKELAEYAHSLHLNYYSFAAEVTYHPALLKEFGAKLTPNDPNFWDALQVKYRRLLQAMPELDGIEICNDDISGFWENYRPYDVMHDGENCDWSYEKRFHMFVKKIYNVVVNEFDKTYFHFTWSLVSNEQHHQVSVYRKIFSENLPTKKLYLIPKITQSDRWWFQAYNPTFNITPHNTIVGFETMNYYESGKSDIFPTCAGEYYQAGLQYFLKGENSNINGTAYRAAPKTPTFGTNSITPYMLHRLSWDHNEDIKTIVKDFCAIHFGLDVAEEMADIYLMSAHAYKYGLHIEPISYGQYNSFLHMRVGTFPAMGYPRLDGGKEHMNFLNEIYLRCKPWQLETVQYLEHGLDQAGTMLENFQTIKSRIKDTDKADEVENSLQLSEQLIRTNGNYAKTIFAYFNHSEKRTEKSRKKLEQSYNNMLSAKTDFRKTPNYGYQLFGVDQLLLNAQWLLENFDSAKLKLKEQPSRKQIEADIFKQQSLYKELLEKHSDKAVKFFELEAGVDGRDILHIAGDKWKIEHLRWDGAFINKVELFKSLPKQAVTVIAKDIESRPMHQFVLEQPTKENGYSVQVYLYDSPGGPGINHFELYYIPMPPDEFGVLNGWGN
jgi:hypothetical protein